MAKISIRILIMFIWEKNILMPDELHERLIDAIGMRKSHYITTNGSGGLTNATYENVQNDFFTSYDDNDFEVNGLYQFYGQIIEEMMRKLGMHERCFYQYELWTQRYSENTTSHWPHEHFGGCEIISFNHIIDATKKKCFYFLDDDMNKIYPDGQHQGHFFAWPPWRVHGADQVTEPNINRLIVAGNVTLLSMNDFHNFQLTCEEPAKDVYVWKRIKYENIAGAKELPFKPLEK